MGILITSQTRARICGPQDQSGEKKMSSDRLQLSLQKRLNACLKKPENIVCAECPSRLPRWASMNLGIFICTNCSGIHRSLGVHISFVRSTTLDTWKEKQVVDMETMGPC